MTRNVVVVVLDSTRKDYFDEYAPRLRDGADVEFDRCRAASNWSPESHGAMVTGELPHVSGIHGEAPDYGDTDIADTFLDAFCEHHRWGISSNVFVSRPYGFDDFFDEFTNVSRHALFAEGAEIDSFLREVEADGPKRYVDFLRRALAHDATLKSIANELSLKANELLEGWPLPRLRDYGTRTQLRWARERAAEGPEPFFGFINLMETHNPHANNVFYDGKDVPDDWWSDRYRTVPYNNMLRSSEADPEDEHVKHYRDVYAASIEYVDARLSAWIDEIQAATDEETTVVVTSDHGENLCYPDDGGLLGHIGNMTESLLHVPLTIHNAPAPVSEPDKGHFSHLDLGDLVAGLADDEMDVRFRERTPAEVVAAAPPELAEDYDYWDRMIRAVYDGDLKYVWDSFGDRDVYRVGTDGPCTEERIDRDWDDSVEDCFEADIATVKGQFAGGKAWTDDAPEERLKKLGYL